MKRLKYIQNIAAVLFLSFCLNACKSEIEDIEKVQENLELTASSTDITLDADHLTDDVVTFNWTEARQLSDEYVVSYTTKLDVVGNNFGSSTVILNYEDEGIFSRSFTSEQLQNWANEKWGVPVNTSFSLQFRMVAQFEGGPTFEAPEVRTVTVNVQPIKTVVFDADKVFLAGSAVPGMSDTEMSQTLENLDQYAYVVDLQPGELQIPVAFNDETNYICPTDGDGTLKDGEPVPVTMRDMPVSWQIEEAGQYRVVVNMKDKTATIFSPETDLKPKTVVWNADGGVETTTEITDLWMHGAINNWGAPIKMDCTVSMADPQILVYTGEKTGKTKFIVYGGSDNNKNLAYAFSCEPKSDTEGQEKSLVLGKVADLHGDFSRGQRNSYYTIPTGTNFLVLDLRNMTILAEKR